MRLNLKTKISENGDGEKQIELFSKIYLSKSEETYVKDFGVNKENILNINTNNSKESGIESISLDEFLTGYKTSSKNILEIMEYRKQIKDSCEKLKLKFMELNKMDSDETIDYTIEASNIISTEDRKLTFCYHCGEELKEPFTVCPHCNKEL